MTKKIALACSLCGNRNYTLKRKPSHTTRMSLKKYCRHCQSHTIHKETK